MDYSFVFAGKTYYIITKDNNTFYMDESENILDSTSAIELEKRMFNYFTHTNPNPQELDNAIQSNPYLTTQKEVFRQFLKYIEYYVPLSKREEFYEKIKTLKYEISTKIENEFSHSNMVGFYTFENNTITINEEAIKKANQVSFSYGNAIYLTILFHELTHFASSSYDKDNDELFNGFNHFKGQKTIRLNNGLTEGVTEFITFLRFLAESGCDAELVEQATLRFLGNGYVFNSLLVAQLCIITSPNIVYGTYFQNLGIIPLCKKLSEIDHDFNNALKLFAMIETDFYNRSEERFTKASDLLGLIQIQMINYFKMAIKNDIMNNKSEEEIRQRIDFFEKKLISEAVLKFKNIDINDYPEIVKSIETFQELKDSISKYYQGYNQNMTL